MSDWIAPDEFITSEEWHTVEFKLGGRQHIAQNGSARTLCGCNIEPNGKKYDLFSMAYLCSRCHPKYIAAVPRTAAQIAEYDKMMADHLEMVRALKGRKRK